MRSKYLSYVFLAMAVGLGLLHAWVAADNHSMNADGISYLDMGDAFMRGDRQMAINSIWSPMYAWVLGVVMRLVNPPMRWEFPTVHLVNFAIYLVALLCFDYFWRQVRKYHHGRNEFTALPDWAWIGLGYSLFISSSLILYEMWSVSPDMLMAAFVYLAAALIVRIRLGDIQWLTFVLLGLLLGLGYLAKSIMFPVSFLFLFITVFAVGNVRLAIPRILVALLVFLTLSLSFIAVLSASKGELTISNAGVFTYAKHVNGVPFSHWQGESPGNGTPLHPTRKILETPPIYEFGTPIGGTYPVTYDPSYWYEGLQINFNLRQQVDTLLESGLLYFNVFIGLYGGLTFSVILLYLMSRWLDTRMTTLLSQWGFVFVTLTVLAFYAVVSVIGRYIGVFVVLFWADMLANVRLPDTQITRRTSAVLSVVAILLLLANIIAFNLAGYREVTDAGISGQASVAQGEPPSWPGEVAEELHRLDVMPGDKVGIIGYGFDSFWARLARVQIVAEMLWQDARAYWFGGPALRADVIRAFGSAGARAIVAENVPTYAGLAGWHQVGNSNYYIYLLGEQQ